MNLFLSEIDVDEQCAFAFLPWRRERCGLPADDWQALQRVYFDLLRLDAAQVLKESGHSKFLDSLVSSDGGLVGKLMSDAFRMMSLHLNLRNYNRLAFRMSCEAAGDGLLRTYASG